VPRDLEKFPLQPKVKPKPSVTKSEKPSEPSSAEDLKRKARLIKLQAKLKRVEKNIDLAVNAGEEDKIDDLLTMQAEIVSEIEKISQ
jgi:hypothetical protein